MSLVLGAASWTMLCLGASVFGLGSNVFRTVIKFVLLYVAGKEGHTASILG